MYCQNTYFRSADEIIRLSFYAYDRDFKLILGIVNENELYINFLSFLCNSSNVCDITNACTFSFVFLENATIEYANETVPITWENDIVRGIVEGFDKIFSRINRKIGYDNSHVSGSIRNGIFEGVIEMSNDEEFRVSFRNNSSTREENLHCKLSLLILTIQRNLFTPSFIQRMKLKCPSLLKERKGFIIFFMILISLIADTTFPIKMKTTIEIPFILNLLK